MAASASTSPPAPPSRGGDLGTRASAALFRHPGAKLTFTLGPTLTWMIVIYLVSLGVLLVTSFWQLNELSGQVEHIWGLTNYRAIWQNHVYWTITFRSVRLAFFVTVADIALAFPLSYYAARMASDRVRNALLFAVVMPLWANYLVKVFAWKTMLAANGPLDGALGLFGFRPDVSASDVAVWIALSYLWLPYVILPIFAAFERVPASQLEASSDLGARSFMTFRRVVFPLVLPGVVAASIFSFSLTLGDYITPSLVGRTIFLGNAIDQLVGTAQNRPLAAALATIPIAIMAIYLAVARALGAFEAL